MNLGTRQDTLHNCTAPNMKRIISTLFFTIALSFLADAQTVIVRKRDLNTGSDFQLNSPSMNPSMSGVYYSRFKHGLKLNATAILAGDIPLSYEYKVNDYFTTEIGAGLTTFNLIEDAIRGYSAREDGETLNRMSYSLSMNAKFFPDGQAFQDGYYLALNGNFRNYAQDFYTTSATTGLDTNFSEGFSWRDIGFTMGYQSRPSERMIFDWFIGAGIRTKTRFANEYVSEFDPISGLFTGGYVLNESRNTAPAILGGLKLSILFR